MNIGGCRRQCVDQSAVLIYADMRFIAKVPCIALLDLMCIRIPLLLLVLGGGWRGNDGGINNRSLFRIRPCSVSAATTCVNSFSCNPFFTSRFRKRPMVSPFGTWLLESTPQKSENARLSIASAAVASSLKSYRFCSRYSRSMVSSG